MKERNQAEKRKIIFGDEYIFFEGEDGHPKYENIDEKWEEIIAWLAFVRKQRGKEEGFRDSQADRIGQELIKWAEKKDIYPIFILTRNFWKVFRDTYLVEGHPPIFMEFIKEIMTNKMTEQEMWGDEDRMAKGTVIVFDKKYLPTKEEKKEELKVVLRE